MWKYSEFNCTLVCSKISYFHFHTECLQNVSPSFLLEPNWQSIFFFPFLGFFWRNSEEFAIEGLSEPADCWLILGHSFVIIGHDPNHYYCHHHNQITVVDWFLDIKLSSLPISTITIIIMITVDWFLDIQLSSSSSSLTFKHFIFFWKDILHREVLNTLWKFQMCVSQQIVSAYSTNTQKGSQFCCKNKSNNGRLSSMYCFSICWESGVNVIPKLPNWLSSYRGPCLLVDKCKYNCSNISKVQTMLTVFSPVF